VVDPFLDYFSVVPPPLPGFGEGEVAGLLDSLGDPVHGPVERLFFPILGIGAAILDLGQPLVVDRELEGGRALGAERAAVDWAVGVPLDVDDPAVADADDLTAADGAIGADAGNLARPLNLQLGDGRGRRLQVEPQARERPHRQTGPSEELPPVGL
jgi:hypothetical protein